ncbi:MAG: hypothetical protein MZV64_73775 [Ignavibacteriales bacterium]|nr:hypothetical protein [Ignavibacteriales bacterium]
MSASLPRSQAVSETASHTTPSAVTTLAHDRPFGKHSRHVPSHSPPSGIYSVFVTPTRRQPMNIAGEDLSRQTAFSPTVDQNRVQGCARSPFNSALWEAQSMSRRPSPQRMCARHNRGITGTAIGDHGDIDDRCRRE